MKSLTGQLLLWVGFLAAAFVSVSHLEDTDNKWATIDWTWYVASIAVGVVGIVLVRLAKQDENADETRTAFEYSVIQSSLAKISAGVGTLCDTKQTAPDDVLNYIDNEIVEPFADFAEARQSLVKRFGMSVYANVMTEFASAERYVNRTWSAAADGYIDEVNASINRANQHLTTANQLLQDAERNQLQS